MKVAYVVSGMKLTFVINEMEAHEQAGWEIVPLASRKPESTDNLSPVLAKWCQRAVYRSRFSTQVGMVFREVLTHPIRLAKALLWVLSLVISSPGEFARAVYELPTMCDFAVRCTRFGAQHIHVHFASRSLSLGLVLGVLTGLPISCTVHAFDIFTRSHRGLRSRLARCRFIAAISHYNVEYLRKICGESIARRCRVVHCGVDLTQFKAESRKPQPGLIICVANLFPKKGLDLAIQACARLKQTGVDCQFQIVGDGPLRGKLEGLIHGHGLDKSVVLLGAMPNDQLVRLYNKACVFLMPCVQGPSGDMDGIPVAMMEAMACEVPVVSRSISGVPELVHHRVNGLLVNEKDPTAIAEAVRTLLTDPEKMTHFGREARAQIAAHFDIVKTAGQLRTLIESG